MKKAWMGMMIAGALLAGVVSCAGETGEAPAEDEVTGQLAVNLIGTDSQGRLYRLRDANFDVIGQYFYDQPTPPLEQRQFTLSTETEPDAEFLDRRVLAGQYLVTLRNGWFMERLSDDGFERVEKVVLLASNTQYAYVYPNSESEVTYRFGVDGDLIDFRGGDLRIRIEIEENDAGVPVDEDAGAP